MQSDNLYTGEIAREGLMNGIKKVSNAVGMTLGTSGQNSLLECLESPGSYPTNDGFSIANSIRLSDPLEEMGRRKLLEAINRANKSSGDGSSTTCVLTAAILEEGMKHIGEVAPMELKRSLEDCIPIIEQAVKAQKKEITIDNVAQVASISAEDEGIGNLIQEIYKQIGKDGIIQWDVSKTADDSYSIGTGLTIHGAKSVSPYMCDIDEATQQFSSGIRWTNPAILLCRQKITAASDFNDLFEALFNDSIREIAIFAEDIEVPVIGDLIRTRALRGFKSVVIKMPVLWRDEWWEDLALASGATIIDPNAGISLRNAKEAHLGTFGHLTVNKEDTLIDGIKDLTQHILSLQAEGTDKSLLRASRLNTKTARYFVGGHSESSVAYRRLKVEDSLGASSCALEGGVVAGGGVALLNTIPHLPDTIGGKILSVALKSPAIYIYNNAGKEFVPKPDKDLGGVISLDTRTGKFVNMFEAGIIDPADVVLNAIRNAIGVAASVLTIGTVVLLPRENDARVMQ